MLPFLSRFKRDSASYPGPGRRRSGEVANATDDISELNLKLRDLQGRLLSSQAENAIAASTVDDGAARERMLDALANGSYQWLSIERLASIEGVTVDVAQRILRAMTDEVVLAVVSPVAPLRG